MLVQSNSLLTRNLFIWVNTKWIESHLFFVLYEKRKYIASVHQHALYKNKYNVFIEQLNYNLSFVNKQEGKYSSTSVSRLHSRCDLYYSESRDLTINYFSSRLYSKALCSHFIFFSSPFLRKITIVTIHQLLWSSLPKSRLS